MKRKQCKLSDFKIIQELGKGGFGTAYRATRNSDGLDVCLKEIPLRCDFSEHIPQEAKMLSNLKNEYIIKFYGSFVDSGNCYIVMEYAPEGSLEDLIQV